MSSNIRMDSQKPVSGFQDTPPSEIAKKTAPASTKRRVVIGLIAAAALAVITGASYAFAQKAINVPCNQLTTVTLPQINRGIPVFSNMAFSHLEKTLPTCHSDLSFEEALALGTFIKDKSPTTFDQEISAVSEADFRKIFLRRWNSLARK
jgi:hypothetical protein